MNPAEPEQHPQLKQALAEAYQLGRDAAEVEKKIQSTTSPGF
jgi:hypothetical protein